MYINALIDDIHMLLRKKTNKTRIKMKDKIKIEISNPLFSFIGRKSFWWTLFYVIRKA